MGRGVGGQFLPGAAAPGDGNGLKAGIGGGLHVHAGVSDVQDFLRTMYPGLPKDVPYYRRLRLAGHTLPLPEYGAEGYFREEMPHEPDGRRVVFVRGDGDLDAPAADIRQEFRYALKGPGHIGAMLAIVRQEQAPDAQDLLLAAGLLRQCPFEEFVDAVADVGGYLRLAVDGVAACGHFRRVC